MTDRAVTAAQLKAQLDPLLAAAGRDRGPMIVAVSGGGDSMALALLAHEAYPGRVRAVTIDHGLRTVSAREAAQVGEWLTQSGIARRTLRWLGEKPRTGIQERAREARYALLARAAIEAGSFDLPCPVLTAHTLEDQQETILMRAARGSGAAGLRGMRAASEIAGAPPVPLLRPLLGHRRAELRTFLRSRSQSWIEDPSNEDERFERVRVRQALQAAAFTEPDIPGEPDGAAAAAALAAEIFPEGFARLPRDALESAGGGEIMAALRWLMHAIGGSAYPPRRARAERLAQHLRSPGFRGATLAGCRLARRPRHIEISRELRHPIAPVEAPPGTVLLWDGRFFIEIPRRVPPACTLAPVGPARAQARAGLARPLPATVVAALPGLWRGQQFVTPLLPGPGDASLFVGHARIEYKLCEAWRAWRERPLNAAMVS